MKILLFGGNGFIGERLAVRLAADPASEVKVIGRSVAPSKIKNYIQLDLTKNSEEFKSNLDWADSVVVLTKDDEAIVNNLLSYLGSRVRPIRIIYLSTLLLYADSDMPRDELADINPKTSYEQSKFKEEQKLNNFVTQSKNFKLCVVRMSNVYGGIKNRGVINYIFQSILDSSPITINNTGDSVRDYIFVDDAVDYLSFLTLWDQKSTSEIFNVCTGATYSVMDVIKTVELVTKKTVSYTVGPTIIEKKKIIGNNKKIVSISGKLPAYSLEAGLNKTYQNYLSKE